MESLELIRDFVNTADLEDGEEKLADPRALQYWLRLHGLAELHDRATAADLDEALALREAIRELLRGHTGVEANTDGASAVLDTIADEHGLGIRFISGSVAFEPARSGLGSVLAAVAGAMADGSWERLKACRSDACRWAFIDNARNHSRQWCDMKVCGNRAKARAFRERHGG
ncbi:MAG TPA: CGNR zinc finger domain-containing protein [Gaiellaceae bacterium]|jgi:predicted RNA-binding Zn ribbon-like protein